MQINKSLMMLLAVSLQTACGSAGSGGDSSDPMRAKISESALTRIATIIDQANGCSDVGNQWCQPTTASTEGVTVLPKARSIMVIDDIGPLVFLGKYKNRTLPYAVSADGSVQRRTVDAQVSKGMAEILKSLGEVEANPDRDPEATRQRTNDLGRRVRQNATFNSDIQTNVTGHGSPILGYLAEHNVDSNIVAVTGRIFPSEVLCGSQEDLESYAGNLAASLGMVARMQQVKYVNASFGYSYDVVASRMAAECGERPSANKVAAVLSGIHGLFKTLVDGSKLVLVQAANESAGNWQTDREASDCDDSIKEHRVRVGYFLSDSQDPPATSVAKTAAQIGAGKIPATIEARQSCIDLNVDAERTDFFNASRLPHLFSLEGLSMDPLPFMSTSYATPVALTMLRQATTRDDQSAKEILGSLTNQGAKKFLRWGKTERSRL